MRKKEETTLDTSELENKIKELQGQVNYLSALLEETAKTSAGILVENSRLKVQLQALSNQQQNQG